MSSRIATPFFLLILAACHSGGEAKPEAKAETTAAKSNPTPSAVVAPASAPLRIGAPITKAETSTLANISDQRLKLKNETIATTGTIRSVCQEMGCWMEIVDGKTNAIVRSHNHAFFIPKTASGKQARVEGNLVLVKDGKECDESNAKEASLQIDATGVEIL